MTLIEWGAIEEAHTFDGQLIRKPKIDRIWISFFVKKGEVDPKYTHRGQVWVPGGQYLYLVSAYGDGRLRAAIVSWPDNDKMARIQLSLYNPKGAAFTPAAGPIAFLRREKIKPEELGYFVAGQPLYENYKQILVEATDAVVIALPAGAP